MSVRVPLIATGPLVEATFVARPNQLLIDAQLNGKLIRAHMADRGRLADLLVPNARLLLAPRDEIGRKTSFQVLGVYKGDELVSLDTQMPNRLMSTALASGALPQFARYTRVQREVTVGEHRFDFRLGEGLSTCYIEVKSVGYVYRQVARFPDAPTERGRRCPSSGRPRRCHVMCSQGCTSLSGRKKDLREGEALPGTPARPRRCVTRAAHHHPPKGLSGRASRSLALP